MTRDERRLVWFLRITAAILLLALPAIFMPHSWMTAIAQWFGLGELSDSPLFGYLTRSLSALYALLGLWCLFLACDVRHYLSLLRFMGWSGVGFGLMLLAIDLGVQMPHFWTCIELCFVLGWSLALLLLTRRAERGLLTPAS